MANDRVDIEINLKNAEESIAKLNQIKNLIEDINKNGKIKISVDTGTGSKLEGIKKVFDGIISAITNIGGKKAKIDADASGVEKAEKVVEEASKAVENLDNKDVKIDVDSSELDEIPAKAEAAAIALDKIAVATSALSGAFNFAGDVFDKIAGGAQSIGSAFRGISSAVNIDALSRVQDVLAEMATEAFVGNISDAASRYDIMQTFVPYMELAGVTSEHAQEALAAVNESILGLPLGLDESAQRLRRYQMFLNDIDRATNLTIGLQKAITAGGASEQMTTTAYYQIDRLLSAGKLTQSRQWLSLLQGLGVSIRFLAEEMGDGSMTAQEMAAGLTSGAISTDQFLRALEGLAYNASLDEALGIYKSTIESWTKNIQFAMTRGGETMMKALDNALTLGTNTSITGYMEKIRDGLNGMYKSVGNWTYMNTDNISTFIDKIGSLIDKTKNINFGQIGTGILDNLGTMADIIGNVMNKIPSGSFEKFASFATTLSGALGKIFEIAPKVGPVLGVFDRFKDFDWTSFSDKVAGNISDIASTVSSLLSKISDKTMQDLLSFGITKAPLYATGLSAIGSALGSIGTTLNTISHVKLAFPAAGELMAQASAWGAVAAGVSAAAAALILWSQNNYNLKRENDPVYSQLDSMSKQIDAYDDFTESLQKSTAARQEDMATTEAMIAASEPMFERLRELDSLISSSAGDTRTSYIAEAKALMAELNSFYPDMNFNFDSATSSLDSYTKAWLDNTDAIVSNARAQAAQTQITDIASAKVENEKYIRELQKGLDEARELRSSLYEDYWNTFPKNWATELFPATSEGGRNAAQYLEANKDLYDKYHEADQTIRDYENALSDARAVQRELNDEEQSYIDIIDGASDGTKKHTEVLEELEGSAEGAANAADELSKAYEGIAEAATASANAIQESNQKIIDGFQNTISEIQSGLSSVSGFLDEINQSYDLTAEKQIENLNSQIEYYTKYNENVEKAKQKIIELNKATQEQIKQGQIPENDVATYIEMLNEALGDPEKLNALVNASSEELDVLISKYREAKTAIDELNDSMGELGNVGAENLIDTRYIEQQVKLIDDITKAAEKYNEVGNQLSQTAMKSGFGSKKDFVDEIQSWSQSMSEATTGLDEVKEKVGEFGEELSSSLNEAQNEVETTAHGIVTGMVTAFEGIPESMASIGASIGTVVGDLVSSIKGDFESVGSVSDEIGSSLTESMNSIAEGFSGVEAGFGELSGSAGVAQGAIEALSGSVESLSSSAETASGSVENLASSVKELGSEAQGASGKVSALQASISPLSGIASAAAGAVSALAAAIASLESKTVTITTNFVENHQVNTTTTNSSGFGGSSSSNTKPTGGGGNVAVPFSKGGMVYASKGMFIPKGTDTVPAMLTPGEFVVRKKAVDTYGAKFMEMLNRLDLRNVGEAIMQTQLIPAARTYVNNSRTYDNHATVNQNIITNNQNFTHRRARRYVRALT